MRKIWDGSPLRKKRKIADVMEQANTGGNIVVSELPRLGRSMLEYMEIPFIDLERQINVNSIKEQ